MMFRVFSLCRFLSVAAVIVAFAGAETVLAQSSGIIRGKVQDTAGKPIEGASVTIEFQGGVTRKFETKSNRRGEFTQIGLASGIYKVTIEKEGVGMQVAQAQVRFDQPAQLTVTLGVAPAGAELAEALQKNFNEGVELSRAGKYDEAIAKFQEALKVTDKCADCHYNIGVAYAQKKDHPQAEAAFKQAILINPNYAEAYNGLANLYNAQRRFDEAAQASAEAARLSASAPGGATAEGAFNQGIILWNGGKIAEAKAQFEQAVQLDPKHAEAHYWLGMANLNEGKMPEAKGMFQKYLELAPDGQYAAQAKGIVAQLGGN